MHVYQQYANDASESIFRTIEELARLESPTGRASLVERCTDFFCSLLAPYGEIESFPTEGFGSHRLIKFNVSASERTPVESDHSSQAASGNRLLLLGHADTVWPERTIDRMPVQRDQERLYGPGVLDMKSGLAIAFHAIKLLRELNVAVRRPVSMLVTSDEEVGSPTSRTLIEQEARKSAAVLVLEPGSGLSGALKTARKGVGRFRLEVTGIASHAGVDWNAGASAITEVARHIVTAAGWTDPERGITVNPGVIRGGSAPNVVAQHAEVEFDIRIQKAADGVMVAERFHSLTPQDPRCRLTVEGEINRPAMERTAPIARLYRRAEELAKPLGMAISESSTGGGSDGNFTAAAGIPTLDGLGGVGEGAHAAHESVLIDAIPGRVALLAALLAGL